MIWMIEKGLIYWFSIIITCSVTGTILQIVWERINPVMEQNGFIRMNYVLLRLLILFYLIPAATVVLFAFYIDGILFAVTITIGRMMIVFFIIWIGGILRNIRKSRKTWQTFQKVRDFQFPCEKEIQKIADQCGEEIGIRRKVEVICSPWISTPMIYGNIHPKILLPGKNFTKKELRIIFLHEMTHELHKDILWKQICCLLQWIYWFHPAIKKLYHYYDEWSEAYCDFSVCKIIRSRKAYFSAICKIGTCELLFHGCICSGIYENGSNIKKRIYRAKAIGKMNHIKWLTGTVLCLAYCILGITAVSVTAEGYHKGYLIAAHATETETILDINDVKLSEMDLKECVKKEEKVGHIREFQENMMRDTYYLLSFTLNPNIRIQTKPVYVKRGEKIYVDLMNSEDDDSKRKKKKFVIGIIDKNGKERYVKQISDIMYSFSIKESGQYRIFVENRYNHKIQVGGEFEIKK